MKLNNLNKIQEIQIFLTIFLLWFSVQFGALIEDAISYVFIITVGVFHGSNDIFLAATVSKKHTFIKILLKYMLVIILGLIFYYFSPFYALLSFIIISSFHFGEQHFENTNSTLLKNFFLQFVYGVFIFTAIFKMHFKEVEIVFLEMTDKTITLQSVNYGFRVSLIVLLITFMYLIVKEKDKREIIKEVFFMLLLLLVFKTTTLIFSFAVYFIIWHSVPSIISQLKYISGDLSLTTKLINYLKKGFLFWFLSFLGMLGLYFFIKDITLLSVILFTVLFAITIPHVLIMHRFLGKKAE